MNVHEELQNVIKVVLILMEVTIVHVMMDMRYISIMELCVLVCNIEMYMNVIHVAT